MGLGRYLAGFADFERPFAGRVVRQSLSAGSLARLPLSPVPSREAKLYFGWFSSLTGTPSTVDAVPGREHRRRSLGGNRPGYAR